MISSRTTRTQYPGGYKNHDGTNSGMRNTAAMLRGITVPRGPTLLPLVH